MQELQVNLQPATVVIIDREQFEGNIKEVVAKYKDYTVTAGTVKDDKKVLADLRKLSKSINDERIRIQKEASKPIDEFKGYVDKTKGVLDALIDRLAGEVKEVEEHQKAVRLDTVKAYISKKCGDYQLDARLFDEVAQGFLKVSDFQTDGYTLKKQTMTALDEVIEAEYQKQLEFEKSKVQIAGLCAEYGLTDSPYVRMLSEMSLVEVLEQIKLDYQVEKEKRELEEARRKAEEERQRELEQLAKENLVVVNSETGEIVETVSDDTHEPEKPAEKIYTQTMTLQVYFTDSAEKDRFKSQLTQAGFEHQKNYQVTGYRKIEPIKASDLREQLKG